MLATYPVHALRWGEEGEECSNNMAPPFQVAAAASFLPSNYGCRLACTRTHVFLPLLLSSSSMPVRAAYVTGSIQPGPRTPLLVFIYIYPQPGISSRKSAILGSISASMTLCCTRKKATSANSPYCTPIMYINTYHGGGWSRWKIKGVQAGGDVWALHCAEFETRAPEDFMDLKERYLP